MRELRITNSLLDKVTKAEDAKNILNAALADATIKQRAYTDMLLQSCPYIIILFDIDERFVLSTEAFMSTTNTPNFDYIKNRKYEEAFPKYFSADGMENFKAAFEKASELNEVISFDAMIDFTQTGQPRFYTLELRRAGTGLGNNSNAIAGILAVMMDFTDFMREKQRAGTANNAKPLFPSAMEKVISEILGCNQHNADDGQDDLSHLFAERRILLAEDMEINREIVLTLLEPLRMCIECAENGLQALKMFEAAAG